MSSSGYVASGLTALVNATQVGALQLSSYAFLSQFSTVTNAANSCLLPINPSSGQVCRVRNDSATGFNLNVFPQVGGQINALGVNIAFLLPVGETAEFVSSGSFTWLTDSSFTPGVPIPAGVTATAGGTRAAALAIPVAQLWTLVGTCATALDSVSLPRLPLMYQPYTIINEGAAVCAVYAGLFADGSVIDLIATNNVNTCYFALPVLGRCTFTAVQNIAGAIQWYSSGLSGPKLNYAVAAARTMLVQETGAIINFTKGAAYAITMPAPAAGLEYTFIQSGAGAAFTVNIDCGAGLCLGNWINTVAGALTGATTAGTAARRLNFLTGASVEGDSAVVSSDGTNWYVRAWTGAAAGVSFT